MTNLQRTIRRILYSPEFYLWTWTELVQAYNDPAMNGSQLAILAEEMDFHRTWAE